MRQIDKILILIGAIVLFAVSGNAKADSIITCSTVGGITSCTTIDI